MNAPVVRKMMFTVTFPQRNGRPFHIPGRKLHSLARNQLPDVDVIETIDHLFRCQRCFETYRLVRKAHFKV